MRSAGRLGNQLFVYSAIEKFKHSGEVLIFVGFSELFDVLPDAKKSIVHIPITRKWWWLWDTVESLLRAASALRITHLLQLAPSGESLQRSPGVTPLTLFDGGFCQDERLLDQDSVMNLQNSIAAVGSEILDVAKASWISPPRKIFFVHVRRGDYVSWPSTEYPAALPASWYTNRIQRLSRKFPHSRFLVFSDDTEYCRETFSNLPQTTIVEAPVKESFFAMSQCDGGIVSASSLSWWAAFISKESHGGPFIAPEYWIGWSESSWEKSDIKDSSFLEWATVLDQN